MSTVKGKSIRIERFEDIEAWHIARELTRKVYGLTKKTKFACDLSLKGQIQDAAGSSRHNSKIHNPPRLTEFQDVYDHTGRTFTLLGVSDGACCHSRFYLTIPPAG